LPLRHFRTNDVGQFTWYSIDVGLYKVIRRVAQQGQWWGKLHENGPNISYKSSSKYTQIT